MLSATIVTTEVKSPGFHFLKKEYSCPIWFVLISYSAWYKNTLNTTGVLLSFRRIKSLTLLDLKAQKILLRFLKFFTVYIILWLAGSVYYHRAYSNCAYNCNHICYCNWYSGIKENSLREGLKKINENKKNKWQFSNDRPFAFHSSENLLNIKSEMRSFKSNENIHKKEGGSYYVVSANKASSVTL